MNLSFWLAIVTSILINSCGRPDSNQFVDGDQLAEKVHQRVYFDDFFLEDPRCYHRSFNENSSSQSFSSSMTKYHYWDGSKVVAKSLTNSTISTNPHLKSSLVSGAILPTSFASDDCQSNTDRLDHSTSICALPQSIEAAKIKICDREKQYHHQSVESIALSSIAHLEKAYQYYLSSTPIDRLVRDTRIYVLPKIAKDQHNNHRSISSKGHIIHDNLGYIGSFYSNPAFLIFPPSAENTDVKLSASSRNTHNQPIKFQLWHSDFALSHEFAHHIVRSHISYHLSSDQSFLSGLIDSSVNFLTSFSKYLFKFSDGYYLITSNSNNSLQKQWEAFEESFADLWAFVATGEHQWKLYFNQCLSHSRNPQSDLFNDGYAKYITKRELDFFLLEESLQAQYYARSGISNLSCRDTDLTKPHVFGASLSYSFLNMHRYDKNNYNLGYKLVLLADNIGYLSKYRDSWDIYDLSYLALAHIAKPQHYLSAFNASQWFKVNFDQSTCAQIRSLFGGMIDRWRELGYTNC